MSSSLLPRLRRLPIPALRDVDAKRPSEGRNLDVLDGIRGLAVLFVVAAHTSFAHMHAHGAVGVLLFFCLSAFLLTGPFVRRPERLFEGGSLRHYAARRLRRVLPAYYLILVSTYLLRPSYSASWLLERVVFIEADGIFWTIPQEMLFYVCLPVLATLYPLLRRSFPLTLGALAALAVASNVGLDVSIIALPGVGRRFSFQLGAFLSGMTFAYACHWPPLARLVARRSVNQAVAVLGLAILAVLVLSNPYVQQRFLRGVSFLGPPSVPLHASFRGTFGLLCGALVYVAVVCEGRLIHRLLSFYWLRVLGVVSYSLYLVHAMVMFKLMRLGAQPGFELFASTLAVSFAIACVLYALIERPLLMGRARSAGSGPSARHP